MPTKNPDYSLLKILLKAVRKSKGLSQKGLAGLLGKEQPWVSKIENGEIEIDLTSLNKWAEIIGMDASSILLVLNTIFNCDGDTYENAIKALDSDIGIRLSILPQRDADWQDIHWKYLNFTLENEELFKPKDLASVILGALNPPQVGTTIASKESFQKHYPPRETWKNVRIWLYSESGNCADCGTKLDLQADHVNPVVKLGEAADTLDNLKLRCRRCNVIRRESHKKGGATYLSAQSALMWILLSKRPKTYKEYKAMCRAYGLTMAAVRFEEAWAMAIWLSRENKYEIS